MLEAQILGKEVQGPEPPKPKDYDTWVNARFKELNLPTVEELRAQIRTAPTPEPEEEVAHPWIGPRDQSEVIEVGAQPERPYRPQARRPDSLEGYREDETYQHAIDELSLGE